MYDGCAIKPCRNTMELWCCLGGPALHIFHLV